MNIRKPMPPFRLDRRADVLSLTLARPDVRNALDDVMVQALRDWARETAEDEALRVVVLAGEGPVFCAGADLGWMQRMREYDEARNLEDALAVADMFAALAALPVPVVARVQGGAFGGGAGLLAVSDYVIAATDARIGFTEARVGILPATIAPYVIGRIGDAAARALFLTARRIDAAEARRLALVQDVVEPAELDGRVQAVIDEILLGAPSAHRETKALMRALHPLPDADTRLLTARAIARQRVSAEGQEGLRAFLDHRPPSWHHPQAGHA